MSAREMKQAIRDGHEGIPREEFLSYIVQKRDAGLLDLYLDSAPTVPARLGLWGQRLSQVACMGQAAARSRT